MNEPRKTVLVVGSTGSIGRFVMEEAVMQGYTVRALMRTPSKASKFPSGSGSDFRGCYPTRDTRRRRHRSPCRRFYTGIGRPRVRLELKLSIMAACAIFYALSIGPNGSRSMSPTSCFSRETGVWQQRLRVRGNSRWRLTLAQFVPNYRGGNHYCSILPSTTSSSPDGPNKY